MVPPPSASSSTCCTVSSMSRSTLSPTVCGTTASHGVDFCPASNIVRAGTAIIVLKTHIDQGDDKNGRCKGLSPLSRHNGFSRPRASFMDISDHGVIAWQQRVIGELVPPPIDLPMPAQAFPAVRD
jgi:hypothetical protein